MTVINPEVEQKLRQGFKYFNKFMIAQWRLGLGPWLNVWPEGLGRFLVIGHVGRKSGLKRYTPVNYAEVDGEVYVTAGFGSVSDWYRNLRANPAIELWLPDGRWAGVSEEVLQAEPRLRIMRQVIINSGFAGRLAGLQPHTMSDEVFEQATREYRLLHLRRVVPITGPDGPGELSWVWPLSTAILLILLLFKRRD